MSSKKYGKAAEALRNMGVEHFTTPDAPTLPRYGLDVPDAEFILPDTTGPNTDATPLDGEAVKVIDDPTPFGLARVLETIIDREKLARPDRLTIVTFNALNDKAKGFGVHAAAFLPLGASDAAIFEAARANAGSVIATGPNQGRHGFLVLFPSADGETAYRWVERIADWSADGKSMDGLVISNAYGFDPKNPENLISLKMLVSMASMVANLNMGNNLRDARDN